MVLGGLDDWRRIGDIRFEESGLVVRRRVSGNEFGTGIEEKFLKGRNTFLATNKLNTTLVEKPCKRTQATS